MTQSGHGLLESAIFEPSVATSAEEGCAAECLRQSYSSIGTAARLAVLSGPCASANDRATEKTPNSAKRRCRTAATDGMAPRVESTPPKQKSWRLVPPQIRVTRSRSAFTITLKEESAMAAAAMIGDRRSPVTG